MSEQTSSPQVQPPVNQSVPPTGWNWGAFFLSWIWGIGNQVWISFLVFIPIFGWFIMPFILGAKGNEWAWKKGNWQSVEHFKKTQKTWGWVGLGVWAFFFAVGMFNHGGSTNDAQPVSGTPAIAKTTPSSQPASAKHVPKIGDTVKVGDLEYTILSVTSASEIKEPFGNAHKPGAGQFLILKVQIKNDGKEKITADSSMFKLKDTAGAEYDADSDADIWINDDNGGFFLEPLNPHAVKTGKIAFDVPPVSADKFTFEGAGGIFSVDDPALIQLKK